jgi:hypothetical protein
MKKKEASQEAWRSEAAPSGAGMKKILRRNRHFRLFFMFFLTIS